MINLGGKLATLIALGKHMVIFTNRIGDDPTDLPPFDPEATLAKQHERRGRIIMNTIHGTRWSPTSGALRATFSARRRLPREDTLALCGGFGGLDDRPGPLWLAGIPKVLLPSGRRWRDFAPDEGPIEPLNIVTIAV